jgi:hypothetical protein
MKLKEVRKREREKARGGGGGGGGVRLTLLPTRRSDCVPSIVFEERAPSDEREARALFDGIFSVDDIAACWSASHPTAAPLTRGPGP